MSLSHALYSLNLPMLLPGDKPLYAPEDAMYVLPDGTSMGLSDLEGLSVDGRKQRHWDFSRRAFAFARATQRRSRPMWVDGHLLEVSTVYLGINHNFWNRKGPAVLWESMIFETERQWRHCRRRHAHDGRSGICCHHSFSGGDYQWRYCTQAAAYNGHDMITRALAARQRHSRRGQRARAQIAARPPAQ